MINKGHHRLFLIAVAVALVATVGIAVWTNRSRLGRIWQRVADPESIQPMAVDVSRSEFPVKGIDVSHHNGDIDFRRVAADSVEFVMIKATEGVNHIDSCMARNYDRATEAGLKVGFYHFFRFDRGGVKQGRHFLAATSGRAVDLPLVIDVEISGNPDVDYYRVIGRLKDMIGYLRRHDRRVMIYCNSQTYDRYIRHNFNDTELWLASESTPKDKGDSRELWQHSHAGHVRGIPTPVDINTFNGNREQFAQWLNSFPRSAPAKRPVASSDSASLADSTANILPDSLSTQ